MKLAALTTLFLLTLASPAAAATCTSASPTAKRVALTVSGDRATGFAALPSKAPRALVVVAHGYSFTATSWKSKLKRIARGDGALAVAPDFRGLKLRPPRDGFQRSRGIPIRNAVADVIAYAKSYVKRCPTIKRVVLVGYSIGGVVSGNALIAKPKRAGRKPLFDVYVGLQALQDVEAEFELAKAVPNDAFVQGAVKDAADELGGTIEEKPAAYRAVSPIKNLNAIRESGIKGVFLVHGADDGLVPYSQATDMTEALRGRGIKTDLLTARKRRPGDAPDTTLSGRFGQPSGDTGHVADFATRHLIPETGLKLISDYVRKGRLPANRSFEAQG